MRHPPIGTEQMQIGQRHLRLHLRRDLGPATKAGPNVVCPIIRQRKLLAGGFIEMDQPLFVEKLTNLVAGHLLRGGSLTDEELAPERIRFAVLRGNGHAQHLANFLDLHRNGRFGRAGNGLHFGFQPIGMLHSIHLARIGDPNQDHPARGIGKGADFPAKVGRARPLELGGEAFPKGDKVV